MHRSTRYATHERARELACKVGSRMRLLVEQHFANSEAHTVAAKEIAEEDDLEFQENDPGHSKMSAAKDTLKEEHQPTNSTEVFERRTGRHLYK